jgi:Domain of unknown function (DUF6265)
MKKRMVMAIGFLLPALLTGLSLSPVGAQTKGGAGSVKKTDVQSLSWLAGFWRDEDKDHPAEEHWTAPSGGAMLGMCRLGKTLQDSTFEIMIVEERAGKLVYSFRHFASGLRDKEKEALSFDVQITGPSEVIFEGRDSKRPTKLTYTLSAPDKLTIVLERTRDGKTLRDVYKMKRNG